MVSPWVCIVMGSDADAPVMSKAADALEQLEIPFEMSVASAHRSPDRLRKTIEDAERNGARVFIAGAGAAAHLPGVIASLTIRPVIGVPLEGTSLLGLDALLAIVQMPGGIPVATVAIGAAGARNAALLAAEILAIADEELSRRLVDQRRTMAADIATRSAKVERRTR